MKDIPDNRLLRGRPVSDRILRECAAFTKAHPGFPRLVSISIGKHAEVAVYMRNGIVAFRRQVAAGWVN